ncbi:DNA alkylation repair protein [Marinobacterium marinum]|uniref:DNA alkylation repair protein n=1 Tax=Marinobacterium marinum TaxID=2756129 RepID=A0A7W1WWX8_9GAMM|nr:DNA alkylation repair protein [Marinobacterium marinum]MBA4501753.1 DNA alkylation repair protein [Marinobacterium marinum]
MSKSLHKGATRIADIAPETLAALSCGELQSATLTEGLAVDQSVLLRTVFPDLSAEALSSADALCQQGIVKRMQGMGRLLLNELGSDGIRQCLVHHSDTVRGWACFMLGAQPGLDIQARLEAIRPLANDGHFGVREWSWIAIRPHLSENLELSVKLLLAWTQAPSERLRRFASEVLRPRGVWCAHINPLKQQPALALPLLSALRSDEAVYVQDSVANWLNDAAKDQPEWVRDVCRKWLQDNPSSATRRICQRAQRNLR